MERLCSSLEWLRSGAVPSPGSTLLLTEKERRHLSRVVDNYIVANGVDADDDGVKTQPVQAFDAYLRLSDRSELLYASRAALPNAGEAGTSDIMDVLPEEEGYLLLEGNCLSPTPPSPSELAKFPVICGVADGEYVPLLKRMIDAGMVHLFSQGEGVIENGVFGISKTASPTADQRVIWDGRRSNLFFNKDLADVMLPSPDMFAELLLAPGQELFLSTSDVSQMYNRLLAPRWLWRYFGLPRVWGPDLDTTLRQEFYFPALKVLPMGWTLAVRFAQACHVQILRTAGVKAYEEVVKGRYIPVALEGNVVAFIPYIDDCGVVGASPVVVNTRHVLVKRQFAADRLPIHPDKEHPADRHDRRKDCLGMSFFKDGTIRPRRSYLSSLLSATSAILQNGCCSPKDMQQLLGKWVWALLLRRPLLSIFSDVYAFCSLSRPQVIRPLGLPVRTELEAVIDLAPLVFRDLRRQVSSRVYATDASPWGAGVVYSDLGLSYSGLGMLRDFRPSRIVTGWYAIPRPEESTHEAISDLPDLSSLQDPSGPPINRLSSAWSDGAVDMWRTFHWKLAMAHRWRSSARASHINLLEVEALVLAVRHMSRSAVTANKRVLVFLDSLVALGALSKGRSASRRLNRLCRKLAAYSVVGDIDLLLHWVPTAHQPADAASRRFAPRQSR